MVDAEDLKSFGHCDRVGSSPTIPTKTCLSASGGFLIRFGCVAQLVRALRSHRRGRRFESAHIHHKNQIGIMPILFLSGGIGRDPRGSEQARFARAVKGALHGTFM